MTGQPFIGLLNLMQKLIILQCTRII